MNPWQKSLSHLAVVGLLIASLATGPAQAKRHQNTDLTLLSFGSMQGELVTCGCHSSPKGGLARRAAVVDSLVAAKSPFLHLELGDFARIDDVIGDHETSFIWSVLERTKVTAMSPGPRELTMWNTIAPLREKGDIPFISSNLTVTRGGKESAVGRPYEVFKINGLKVAVFALLGKKELDLARPPEGVAFAVQDPLETARDLTPKLRGMADLVVLMSQMDPNDTAQLLRDVPGIDVALYGQRPKFEPDAKRIAGTIVNQTGTRGQYAGELILIVDPAGGIAEFGSRNFALGNLVVEDQDVARLVAEAQAKSKEMLAGRPAAPEASEEKVTASGK